MSLVLDSEAIVRSYKKKLRSYLDILSSVFGIVWVEDDCAADVSIKKFGDKKPERNFFPIYPDPLDLDLLYADIKAMALSRDLPDIAFTQSIFETNARGINREEKIGEHMAGLAINAMLIRLVNGAITSLSAADTPSANAHIEAAYVASEAKSNLSRALIDKGRFRCGHNFSALLTAICHSQAIPDILGDQAESNSDLKPAILAPDGFLRLGQLAILPVDLQGAAGDFGVGLLRQDPGGGDYIQFRTLLAARGALGLFVNLTPVIAIDEDEVWTIGATIKFAPHVFGMKYTGGQVNPTDQQWETSGNWDEAYADHRELLLALLSHNSSLSEPEVITP